jgi:host factor-I protein
VDTKSSPQNIQDAFLNTARREKDTVTIHLLNGVTVSGRIKSFDRFSVLLEQGREEQLIFKHAISTILHRRRGTGELARSAFARCSARRFDTVQILTTTRFLTDFADHAPQSPN